MKRSLICILVLGGILMTVNPVRAQEGILDTVLNGCKEELTKYCSNVTPGEGRLLACLFAYEDKLSGRCEYALYDAASRLERAVAALSYAVKECSSDLSKYCADVAAGEGRLQQCLQKNDDKVSQRCKQARKDVGMK